MVLIKSFNVVLFIKVCFILFQKYKTAPEVIINITCRKKFKVDHALVVGITISVIVEMEKLKDSLEPITNYKVFAIECLSVRICFLLQ